MFCYLLCNFLANTKHQRKQTNTQTYRYIYDGDDMCESSRATTTWPQQKKNLMFKCKNIPFASLSSGRWTQLSLFIWCHLSQRQQQKLGLCLFHSFSVTWFAHLVRMCEKKWFCFSVLLRVSPNKILVGCCVCKMSHCTERVDREKGGGRGHRRETLDHIVWQKDHFVIISMIFHLHSIYFTLSLSHSSSM